MLVLSLVLIGLAITLDPIPLTAFILILASKDGVRKGAAFIFGWLVSLAIVIAGTGLVTGNKPPKPHPPPPAAPPPPQPPHRRWAAGDRDPVLPEAGQAETAEKASQVA